jgi:hypothetical protein
MMRNFNRQLRVVMSSQQRIAVVGNGNFDVGKTSVGKTSAARKPGQPMVETPAGNDSSSARRIDKTDQQKMDQPRICGAMAQQCGDSGRSNESAPQKFVRLVGCRDTSARPEAWIRPRPAPVKR